MRKKSGSDSSCSLDFTTRGVPVQLDGSFLGEVIIFPSTTISNVREMIREELLMDVKFDFVLKKNNIPLPRNLDSRRVCLFLSKNDFFVVVPTKK